MRRLQECTHSRLHRDKITDDFMHNNAPLSSRRGTAIWFAYLFQMFVDPLGEGLLLDCISLVWNRREKRTSVNFWPKNRHFGTNLEFSLSHPSMPCIGHPRPCQYHQRWGDIQLNSWTVEIATITNGQNIPISDNQVIPTVELVECHPTPHRQEIMYFWHTLDELLLRTEILPPKQLLLQQSEFGYLFSRGWIIITLGQMGLWRGCGCYLCYLCKMRRHFDTLFA